LSIYALNCISKRRKYNTKVSKKERKVKLSERTKQTWRFFKWFFRFLGIALIIWVIYSCIVVSGYDPLPLVPGKISRDYIEFRGAAHIHTTFSRDGHGTPEEVIKTAKEIGLDFIIISDHNSMGAWDLSKKRGKERPLMLIGNEISTDMGHLLAYNMQSKRNIFPDSAQAAIDIVREAKGIAVTAHPTRRKTPWKDFTVKGIDGIEIMNFEDSIFGASRLKILSILPQGFINQRGAFAFISEYPAEGIRLWDELNKKQKTVGFAGNDAHGPLVLGFPAYRNLLGTVGIHIVARKTQEMLFTKKLLEESLRNGNFYISIDGIAISRHIDFRLTRKDGTSLLIGDETDSILPGDNLVFAASLPEGCVTKLVKDGVVIKTFTGDKFTYPLSEPGAYRIEVIIPKENNPYGRDKTWVITNHLYVKNRKN